VILLAGGTGTLGTQVVRALVESGTPVRILTRRAERAAHLTGDGIEVCVGDIRDQAAIESAVRGATMVVSAVQGFAGTEPAGAKAVDLAGNSQLIRAARNVGVRRFVLVSALGAAPDSPLELRRVKYETEQTLIRSKLEWTIVRPTVYLETWRFLLDEMAAKKGSVTVFGLGTNPINFVSVRDVAALVERATRSAELAGAVLEIGGPENLTLNELVRTVLAGHDGKPRIRHVPLPAMRAASVLLRRVQPMTAALIQFGITMDTTDMTLPHDSGREAVPDLPLTWPKDVLSGD
jgi:NADH dehydrogenase